VPSKIVKSADFYEQFGKESVDKFVDMTGVSEHRVTGPYQTASDLGFAAAEKLMKEKNIDPESIGAIVFGAHSTDYRRPATACVLHKRLGLSKECVAFDVGLGCSAFVYCVQAVASMMQSSDIEKALVIVGETMSKMINPKDQSTAMLFGDAGAAALLEKQEGSKIKGLLRSNGEGYRSIIAPAGGFRNMNAPTEEMIWADGNPRTLYNTNMNGTDVFSFTISDVPKAIKDFLKQTETTVEDYDCYAMHQANQFIHKQLAKKLKADMEKMPLCLDRYGNTSAPAIPLTLCDRYGLAESSEELNVLMCGFGVGLSWGVLSAEINTADIYPVFECDEYFAEGIINSPEDM
ncbi:MAG: ketoacyl-ACP synthase III, partial [Clostridia bacterium]|nr:ketoacyl-ACP synthase III [Clostridia bacterium]